VKSGIALAILVILGLGLVGCSDTPNQNDMIKKQKEINSQKDSNWQD
jgi:hypothetical protein